MTFNEYLYYASGRQNMMYSLFRIDLKKRQCLFSSLSLELVWPKRDQVTIEVPIRVPEYSLGEGAGSSTSVPLEFMIVRKRNLKNLFAVEQYAYLKNFVAPVQPNSLKHTSND